MELRSIALWMYFHIHDHGSLSHLSRGDRSNTPRAFATPFALITPPKKLFCPILLPARKMSRCPLFLCRCCVQNLPTRDALHQPQQNSLSFSSVPAQLARVSAWERTRCLSLCRVPCRTAIQASLAPHVVFAWNSLTHPPWPLGDLGGFPLQSNMAKLWPNYWPYR